MIFDRHEEILLKTFNQETINYNQKGTVPCSVSGIAHYNDDYHTGYRPIAGGKVISILKFNNSYELIGEESYRAYEPVTGPTKFHRNPQGFELKVISELLLAA